MPRLPRGSYIREFTLEKPEDLLRLLDVLAENGLREIGVTIEPGVVDVSMKKHSFSIAISSPSIIIYNDNRIPGVKPEELGFYMVTKDTWIDYVEVDLEILRDVFKRILSGESIKYNAFEVLINDPCISSGEIIVVDNLVLKYPLRRHVESIDTSTYSLLRREKEKTILVARVKGNQVIPLVWLEKYVDRRILHLCRPRQGDPDVGFIIQATLDVLLYLSENYSKNGDFSVE